MGRHGPLSLLSPLFPLHLSQSPPLTNTHFVLAAHHHGLGRDVAGRGRVGGRWRRLGGLDDLLQDRLGLDDLLDGDGLGDDGLGDGDGARADPDAHGLVPLDGLHDLDGLVAGHGLDDLHGRPLAPQHRARVGGGGGRGQDGGSGEDFVHHGVGKR